MSKIIQRKIRKGKGMVRTVQMKVEVWSDEWAALEKVAERSETTAEKVLDGVVDTGLAELTIIEHTVK